MGEAYICDRCGSHGHEPETRLWEIDGGLGEPLFPHALRNDYYLCESCSKEFDEWMVKG